MADTFAHAGSMGGQNVWDCTLCGCMVRDGLQVQHTNWHEQKTMPPDIAPPVVSGGTSPAIPPGFPT